MILNNMLKKLKKMIILINDYSLSSVGTFNIELLEELEKTKYNDLEDVVYRFKLTSIEIIDILNLSYVPSTAIGYTLPRGLFEIIDINLMLESLLSKEVKVNNTIDDVRLKPNLTTKKTLKFTRKSSFYTILGFIESHSGERIR